MGRVRFRRKRSVRERGVQMKRDLQRRLIDEGEREEDLLGT